jgi:signal transduction histidine kinase
LIWAAVVLAGSGAIVLTAAGPFPPGTLPREPGDWLILALLAAAAMLLATRPLELGPHRKVTTASAPVLALALLFSPAVAAGTGALVATVSQRILRRSWPVVAFNAAQRALSMIGAGMAARAVGDAVGAGGALHALGAVAAAAAYLAINSGSVALMAAARGGRAWLPAWAAILRDEGGAELGLLGAGALLALLARDAPAALALLALPLWLSWRVLAGAAQIRRLNEQLAQQMARQRRFMQDAAHELRTPVASLRAQLEALQAELREHPGAAHSAVGPSALSERVDELARQAARLSSLLADLLTLARADEQAPLQRAPVNLDELLVEVAREARPLAGHVRLQLQLDDAAGEGDEALVVEGDAERLRQMVLNLVSNGLRFTPAGGRVTIRLAREGQCAVIAVEDTGAGIAPEHLPHIFDRFYRADAGRSREAGASGGAGLGLAIARWVAEAHGGTIGVESEVGKGSRFTVRLPLAGR